MTLKPTVLEQSPRLSFDCLILAATRAGKPFFFWSACSLPAWQQRYLAASLGATVAGLVARLWHQVQLADVATSPRFLVESARRVWCLDLSTTDCVFLACVGESRATQGREQRWLETSLLTWLRRALLCQLQASVLATLRDRPAFEVHRYIDVTSVSRVFHGFWSHPLAYTLELLPVSGPLLYPSQRSQLLALTLQVVSIIEKRTRPARVRACLLVDLVTMGVVVARIPTPCAASRCLLMLGLVGYNPQETCLRMQIPGEQPQYLLVAGSNRYRLVYALEYPVSPVLFEEEPIRSLHESILQMAYDLHTAAMEMLMSPLMNLTGQLASRDNMQPASVETETQDAPVEPFPLVLAALFEKSRKLIGTNTNHTWNMWLFAAYQDFEERHRHEPSRTPFCQTVSTRSVYCFPEVVLYGETCVVFVGIDTANAPSGVTRISTQIPKEVEAIQQRWVSHLQQLSLHSPVLGDAEQDPEWYLVTGLCRLLYR
ncbi:hypothetical protein F1559_001993 [Cyanidiococcus yangmingshanensis]|uniref:Uncharacterized protein n=1 Tax=Cyanidiococcus yangmingshanensis TaxID=2690220 RepID=A0A7J7IG96_9RHOD|nr:hypothetical protein F1559_001993 [Cyanidiococcus yangmingshanensis]